MSAQDSVSRKRLRSLPQHSTPEPRRGPRVVQNLRRGHYDIATDSPGRHRLGQVFDELAQAI